jgi:hypothetical protein
MIRRHPILCLLLLAAVLCEISSAQSDAKPAKQDIPTVDGALGPCSLQLTVNDADGKPIYAATVKVHIPYGFGGFHKLDLEGGTNSEGKVRFTGLPTRVRRPPLEFEASKDQLFATITYDPAVECRAIHSVVLDKPKPAEDK